MSHAQRTRRTAKVAPESLEARALLAAITTHNYQVLPVLLQPNRVVTAPDGNIYFTADTNPSQIGRIHPDGSFNQATDLLPLAPEQGDLNAITVGGDGNLYFTIGEFAAGQSSSGIGRLTTNGEFRKVVLPAGANPDGITFGPDGSLYYALPSLNQIGRLHLSAFDGDPDAIDTFDIPAGTRPSDLVAGNDGRIYFTLTGSDQVGVFDPVTETFGPVADLGGGIPTGITRGPDNRIWLAYRDSDQVAAIDTATMTVSQVFNLPAGLDPFNLISAPDGNLWFTSTETGQVGRLTTQGVVTLYTLPFGSQPLGITVGPDGNLWFANPNRSRRLERDAIGEIDIPKGLNVRPEFVDAVEDNDPSAIFQDPGNSPSLDNVVIATFTDPSVANPASVPNIEREYEYSVDWGDGSAPTPFTSQGVKLEGANFVIRGSHAYAREGIYAVKVTVRDRYVGSTVPGVTSAGPSDPTTLPDGGRLVTVSGEANISNSAIIPDGKDLTATAGVLFTAKQVVTYTDSGPLANFYKVTLNWGDGTATSLGRVAQTGVTTLGRSYQITGDHVFQYPGTYTGTAAIEDVSGNLRTVDFTTVVTGPNGPSTPTAGLLAEDDCGASNTDGITAINNPRFFGTAEPGSIVTITRAGMAGAPIAQTVTDSNGNWEVRSMTLADGSYSLTATITTRTGGVSTIPVGTAGQLLVIDTIGPKVTGVRIDPTTGQIKISFRDERTGLDQYTLMDGINYQFTRKPEIAGHRQVITKLTTVEPSSATADQVVTATVRGGARILHGVYELIIKAGVRCLANGIHDVAGNALDGEFYGYFPSGNNLQDNNADFAALFGNTGSSITAPKPLYSTASPVTPPGTPGTATHFKPRRPGQSIGSILGPPDFPPAVNGGAAVKGHAKAKVVPVTHTVGLAHRATAAVATIRGPRLVMPAKK